MFANDVTISGWICVLVLVLFASYLFLTWPYRYFTNRGIPGPKPVPILGNMTGIGKEPFWQKDSNWVEKYGPVFGMFFFARRNLMVADTQMLKEIFIKNFDHFCDRNPLPNRGLMKYSVFDMNGDGWRRQRHQLSPYFAAKTLRLNISTINRIMDNIVKWLNRKYDQGKLVEAREFSSMMSMDVICSTAFGVEVNSSENPDAELLRKARELQNSFTAENTLMMLAFVFPTFGKVLDFLKFDWFDARYFEKFTRYLIAQRKEFVQNESHDLVHILLQERRGAGKGLSDEEIIANAILFLMAGYDTTAGTLSFLLYNLAVYPECQEKVFKEIQEHIGDQLPDYDNIQALTYLEMCIDETLRLYPFVLRLDRLCVKDITVQGVLIEKGTLVVMPVWYVHRNPHIWPHPDTFDPERFTAEKKKARDPLHYVPFGVGPRQCMGMRLALLELKMAAVRILQKFKFMRTEKTEVPLQLDPKGFLPQAKNGIWLQLETRA